MPLQDAHLLLHRVNSPKSVVALLGYIIDLVLQSVVPTKGLAELLSQILCSGTTRTVKDVTWQRTPTARMQR